MHAKFRCSKRINAVIPFYRAKFRFVFQCNGRHPRRMYSHMRLCNFYRAHTHTKKKKMMMMKNRKVYFVFRNYTLKVDDLYEHHLNSIRKTKWFCSICFFSVCVFCARKIRYGWRTRLLMQIILRDRDREKNITYFHVYSLIIIYA